MHGGSASSRRELYLTAGVREFTRRSCLDTKHLSVQIALSVVPIVRRTWSCPDDQLLAALYGVSVSWSSRRGRHQWWRSGVKVVMIQRAGGSHHICHVACVMTLAFCFGLICVDCSSCKCTALIAIDSNGIDNSRRAMHCWKSRLMPACARWQHMLGACAGSKCSLADTVIAFRHARYCLMVRLSRCQVRYSCVCDNS